METPQLSVIKAPSHDVAASASASLAKATIEAKFTIALTRPRSVLNARAAILDACKRPAFADGALYRVRRGNKEVNGRWEPNFVEGLSIRFAEQALNAWRNVDVSAVTAWENDEVRLVRISVTDLEANLSYTDEVLLAKTQERKKLRDGQEAIGERVTSTGEKVFIVRCTEDDLLLKLNAAKSKVIRNSGLRLIPQDILEEAERAVRDTREKGGDDPRAATKKLCDAFATVGVNPSELELFLGHSLESVSPKELANLRSIYAAIRDGEASWSDYIKSGDSQDEIPMSDAPPTPPPQQPASKELRPARGRQPEGKPQDVLADAVIAAGFTFDDFLAWGRESGHIEKPESYTAFADIPDSIATRLCKARKGVVEQIAAMKGGAA